MEKICCESLIAGLLLKLETIDNIDFSILTADFEKKTGEYVWGEWYVAHTICKYITCQKKGTVCLKDGITLNSFIEEENKTLREKLVEIAGNKVNDYINNLDVEEYKEYKGKVLTKANVLIVSDYQERINQSKKNFSTLKSILDNYSNFLSIYSTFDAKLIGSILEKLVSIIEGDSYTYQVATHDTFEREATVFGNEIFKVTKEALLIVKNGRKEDFYCDSNEEDNRINKLIRNKKGFLLSESKESNKREITFYTFDNGVARCLVDFNGFTYVKEFIDSVIQFRYNSLEKANERQLLVLLSDFILTKKDLIEENYKKHILEKEETRRDKFFEEERRKREREEKELEDLLENGVPSKYSNNLIDRLQETLNSNPKLKDEISNLSIIYEGHRESATITMGEILASSENILISKINIQSTIRDYFDEAEQGYPDIDLEDNGIMGIVEVSNLDKYFEDIILSASQYSSYRIDKINDQYVRVLYLPNNEKYKHQSINLYRWAISAKSNNDNTKKPYSYCTEINYTEEIEKMLACLKEAELIGNLNDNQMILYKKKKNNL